MNEDISNFMDDLREAARTSNGFVLEIGPAKGDGSTRAFDEGLEERGGEDRLFISVDRRDYMEIKPEASYWHLILGDSRERSTLDLIFDVFGSSRPRSPGIIFMDTHHTYDQMKAELPIWSQITDHQAVWYFHDTHMHGQWNDMNRAIIEWADANQNEDGGWIFEDYKTEPHGLGRMQWISNEEKRKLPIKGLNVGSGQLRYHNGLGWLNIDIQKKWNPDIVADWSDLHMFMDNSMEYVVAHHTIEHVGHGQADSFIKEAYRVLKPGGSLLIFIPDIRALAQRWLTGQIDDWLFVINMMGAYAGDEADRHKWHYTKASLQELLMKGGDWSTIKRFDGRPIEGATLLADWWIMPTEAIK